MTCIIPPDPCDDHICMVLFSAKSGVQLFHLSFTIKPIEQTPVDKA